MTCDTPSTGPDTPYACQLPDGHDGTVHGAVVSALSIALWGPGHGWRPTYAGHSPSPGMRKSEAIVIMYLADGYRTGRILATGEAEQVAAFVRALTSGRGSATVERPGRSTRDSADAAYAFRDAYFCELTEDQRRVHAADHADGGRMYLGHLIRTN